MPALLLLLVVAPLLGGCVGLAVGAVATSGVSIAEERSLGEQVDDLALTFDISQRFTQFNETNDGALSGVSLDVTEGRVLLTGNVAEARLRMEAVRLAWQAEGVAEVRNEIDVDAANAGSTSLADIAISNELRALLLFDSDVSKINFNVETVDRVVYITGIAKDDAELERVLNHARTISGVEEVVSYVRILDG
ncbi:MAG: BON domain-containing protein [bacterium]|nr:BON domain-containing protein [bacterium]MDE0238629.1 BON domain-containing protein [bacterium]MDE0415599.1 BON domain-containing protein [bacterium]